MSLIKICNRIIEYSFYGLFLLVPWAFWKETSELFELNKMWLTWALTIAIVTAWIIKMVLQRRILLRRTPLDIPIGLFLISQIISTIFSLDSHVSLWGYYSRFNGGLLSIISYILLYYAFVSNFVTVQMVKRLLFISLISGTLVALWGFPSHFGYDPTCFLFRGSLDVSCWTDQFKPTIRTFSTLGQAAWFAAYLALLIPLAIVYAFQNIQKNQSFRMSEKSEHLKIKKQADSLTFQMFWNKPMLYLALAAFLYINLVFANTRAGFIGFFTAEILLFIFLFTKSTSRKLVFKYFIVTHLIFLISSFFFGAPIGNLQKYTLPSIMSKTVTRTSQNSPTSQSPQSNKINITDSGVIRLRYVWKGAISAWKANPIFGTGVETFAFAYYKYKPIGHNLTSEWDYLYNKAHNEYLNYLATTGLVGLATYLGMIITFLVLCTKYYVSSIKKGIHNTYYILLNTGLVASYISILVTNFFGFSVVITNIYLFMIPAFVFTLGGMLKTVSVPSAQKSAQINLSIYQWLSISCIILASLFTLSTLFRFWRADIAYALGSNLDRAGEYEKAYPLLHKAVQLRGDELVFKDELSINDAYIAAGLLIQEPPDDQKEQAISIATSLTQEAINTSNEIISKSPNNAVFWKTRTRVFYTLSQIDSKYLPRALDAIVKASLLAPNDARIWYNLGVLYGQNNDIEKGIEALEKTAQLKPDYRDARYGLGLFYHTASMDEKAIAQMQYILDHIDPHDAGALESITNWSK